MNALPVPFNIKPLIVGAKTGPHPAGFGEQTKMQFQNGYSLSIVCGEMFYSNGVDTYEVAIINGDGNLVDLFNHGDTVMGYLSANEVFDIMKKVALS